MRREEVKTNPRTLRLKRGEKKMRRKGKRGEAGRGQRDPDLGH
jgi:hypothetical protein